MNCVVQDSTEVQFSHVPTHVGDVLQPFRSKHHTHSLSSITATATADRLSRVDNTSKGIKSVYRSNLMSELTSNVLLDTAFEHICKTRLHAHHNDDIWSLRQQWERRKTALREGLLDGSYHLSPLTVIKVRNGSYVSRWNAEDSVVLKAISMVIGSIVNSETDGTCYHLAGRGGLKAAVRHVQQQVSLGSYKYIIKSDIAKYYASMNHKQVMTQVKACGIEDRRILRLIQEYMERVEVLDGEYHHVTCGIAKGCPLSPLIGGLYLKSLDELHGAGIFYARYMDDWVWMVRTRKMCRKLVRQMHEVVKSLGMKLAWDKTYIGRIRNGFSFLGYAFKPNEPLQASNIAKERHANRIAELYEQGASKQRIRQYINNWKKWVKAGVE